LAQSQKPEKVPKVPKVKKEAPKKLVPEHNHPLTAEAESEVADNCDLCQSHGNVADPSDMTSEEFEEVSGDLQSRLKSILADIHESEGEEVDFDGEEEEEEEEEEEI